MVDLQHGHAHHDHHNRGHDGEPRVKDPICGMDVDLTTSKHRAKHGGQTFHFCSARCHDKFVAEPERYLKPATKPAPLEQAGQEPPQKGSPVPVRCTPKSGRRGQAIARSAAWPWNPWQVALRAS
jgi:YHS domain-containing protein